MNRANSESMKTINVTINTNLTSSATPVLLYSYNHGYNYKPQVWGLWDIDYVVNSPGLSYRRRGYGYIIHNTGIGFTFSFYYIADATKVYLYCHFETSGSESVVGTTAQFTGYVFANDRTNQSYN